MPYFITLHIPARETPQSVAAHLTEVIQIVGYARNGTRELQAWIEDTYGRGPTQSCMFEIDEVNLIVSASCAWTIHLRHSVRECSPHPYPSRGCPIQRRRRQTFAAARSSARTPSAPRLNESSSGTCSMSRTHISKSDRQCSPLRSSLSRRVRRVGSAQIIHVLCAGPRWLSKSRMRESGTTTRAIT